MPFASGVPAADALNAKIIYFSLIKYCANRATSGTSWGLREKDGRNKQRKRGKAFILPFPSLLAQEEVFLHICTQQFSGAICGDFVFEFYKNAKIQDTKSADEGADEAEIPTTEEGEREQKRGAFIAFPLAC